MLLLSAIIAAASALLGLDFSNSVNSGYVGLLF
jgi:hypothetical protein